MTKHNLIDNVIKDLYNQIDKLEELYSSFDCEKEENE